MSTPPSMWRNISDWDEERGTKRKRMSEQLEPYANDQHLLIHRDTQAKKQVKENENKMDTRVDKQVSC